EGRRLSPEEAAQIYRNSPINLNLHSSTYHRGVESRWRLRQSADL
ncbi:hypothetical protein B1A_18239, partial [mine drainage metagenome]